MISTRRINRGILLGYAINCSCIKNSYKISHKYEIIWLNRFWLCIVCNLIIKVMIITRKIIFLGLGSHMSEHVVLRIQEQTLYPSFRVTITEKAAEKEFNPSYVVIIF